VLSYGLATGGVDIDMTAQKQPLPQSIQDKVLAVRQQIIDGSLKVEIYKGE
jgi:basic membrane lipoprotein Med (substrate-binding protein (PBP1-ABC) superfamily)